MSLLLARLIATSGGLSPWRIEDAYSDCAVTMQTMQTGQRRWQSQCDSELKWTIGPPITTPTIHSTATKPTAQSHCRTVQTLYSLQALHCHTEPTLYTHTVHSTGTGTVAVYRHYTV